MSQQAFDEFVVEPDMAQGSVSRFYPVAKRALDIAGAALGLVLLLPLFVVVALAIWAQDGGPLLHRREIIGAGGRRFYALKFRTMIIDADGYLQRHPELLSEYLQHVKLAYDPRVTPVSRYLLRSNNDEPAPPW